MLTQIELRLRNFMGILENHLRTHQVSEESLFRIRRQALRVKKFSLFEKINNEIFFQGIFHEKLPGEHGHVFLRL